LSKRGRFEFKISIPLIRSRCIHSKAGPRSMATLATHKKSPNPTDKHVGSRVRMRRIMLGLSQEKLADALGLTFQQVQKYEKGTNRIGASRLQQISNFLRVEVSFFFEGAPLPSGAVKATGSGPSPDYVNEFLSTADGLALTRAFTRITNSKLKRCIVGLVEQIATSRH
jgi:transcriptional regulator with XRE-family HTH domain